jgi:hypothetical protein
MVFEHATLVLLELDEENLFACAFIALIPEYCNFINQLLLSFRN